MSLLEDIFLEDETEEARALERIIEGDEYEDLQARSDEERNSAEEAEEEKRRIDPSKEKTKRVIKNPRFVLNPARLTGPRGIQVIPDHFKDFKFKGKGHEKEDLDIVLKRLEHWAYRLYPKFKFEDCLKKIETLGKKRPVMVHLHKIRTDQITLDEPVIQKDSSDEEANMPEEDEFDKLLQQQIDIARSTPATKKPEIGKENTSSPLLPPQATPSPAMSEEQRERMMRNRKLALERRLSRMKQNNNDCNQNQNKTFPNNDVSNDNENNSASTKNFNTMMGTNETTNEDHIWNGRNDITITNKTLSRDIDEQINSSQTDTMINKDDENSEKELNNKYNNSKVEPVHVYATNNDKITTNQSYIINNTQNPSLESDENRNENNEVNVANSNSNVRNVQTVSVDVHRVETKNNRNKESESGDIVTNNLKHLTGNILINLPDSDENVNNCVANSHDKDVRKNDETLIDENFVSNNEIEMIDDGAGSLQNSVTEVTENDQIFETVGGMSVD